jgi:Protein of unknown function (DUF3262)
MPTFADAAGFNPTVLAVALLVVACALCFVLLAQVAMGLWESRRRGEIESTRIVDYTLRAAGVLTVLMLVLL